MERNPPSGCACGGTDLVQPFMCKEGQVGARVAKLQVEAQENVRAHM